MATRYTQNLRLRIEDDLSADAVYNLQRLDELGAVFQLSTSANIELSSAEDIVLQPNNPAAGGSGIGGTVRIGSQYQIADSLAVYATSVDFSGTTQLNLGDATLLGNYTIPWERIDAGSGGSVSNFPDFNDAVLNVPEVTDAIAHLTNYSNPHQTTAAQVGAYSIVQADLLLAAKANLTTVQTHLTATSGIHGVIGHIVGTTDSQALVNKGIDAEANSITNLKNASISDSAAILGTKIRPEFGAQTIRTSAGLRLDGVVNSTTILPSAAVQSQPLTFRLPSTYGASGQVLVTDGAGNLSWQNSVGAAISEQVFMWLDTDGAELYITHEFNSQNLDITIRDLTDNELIYVPDINMIDNSTIHLISSEPPSNAWQVIIQGVTR